MRLLAFRKYFINVLPRHFSEQGLSPHHISVPSATPCVSAMKASAKEKNQLSRVQKIVYDFVRYFSDVRDHAIGVHEVLSLEEVVRGREDAYRQAREVLRVAREKQERFIKYQKDIANLHSKLTTSDETFKEHLYDRIRRAEAERPFSASYDPLSTDAAAKDSVFVCERTLDAAASALFEARESLYQRKLESTQKREDVNKIIAIISVLLSLAVVEPIRRYFLMRYTTSAKINSNHHMSVQTEELIQLIAQESRSSPEETEKTEKDTLILARGFQERENMWFPFLRGLGLGLGAGLGFGACLALVNVIKNKN